MISNHYQTECPLHQYKLKAGTQATTSGGSDDIIQITSQKVEIASPNQASNAEISEISAEILTILKFVSSQLHKKQNIVSAETL